MGSYGVWSLGSAKTPKEYFDKQHTWVREGIESSVVLSAAVYFTEYYAAVRHLNTSTGKEQIFAVVISFTYNTKSNEVLRYRPDDETSGPFRRRCPIAILDLLSPTESEFALKWRDECRAYHSRNDKRPKLVIGKQLVLPSPVSFRDGQLISRFDIVAGRGRWSRPDANGKQRLIPKPTLSFQGALYRIRNLKSYDYTIEDKAA